VHACVHNRCCCVLLFSTCLRARLCAQPPLLYCALLRSPKCMHVCTAAAAVLCPLCRPRALACARSSGFPDPYSLGPLVTNTASAPAPVPPSLPLRHAQLKPQRHQHSTAGSLHARMSGLQGASGNWHASMCQPHFFCCSCPCPCRSSSHCAVPEAPMDCRGAAAEKACRCGAGL